MEKKKMTNHYDVIIIGAGSVGVPTALALAEKNQKVLVIEALSSPGQDNNKKAIGGIRATHPDFGKIRVSQRSIEIFGTWKEKYGEDIGWIAGGYSFPAYNEEDEKKLKDLMKIQHSFGLNIKWISPEEYNELVPGINPEGLRGSTFSPKDGSASPLLSLNAFYFKSVEFGTEYKFHETVTDLKLKDNKIVEVITDKGKYSADFVINVSGNDAGRIGKLAGFDFPIQPKQGVLQQFC